MKENIIVGRLIPAGTGLIAAKYHKQANKEKQSENSLNLEDGEIIEDLEVKWRKLIYFN